MNKNYIKLNNNTNHLSLGNFFNIIKNNSKNKCGAIQSEIFCTLMNIDNISETTINNYCTGYRSINPDYKQIYINYLKKYNVNKEIMIPIINNLLQIIDGIIYNYQSIKEINNQTSFINITKKLHILSKNDIYVPIKTKKTILTHINKKNYYEAFTTMLFFIILEKKQPIYEEDEINYTIEEIIKNTNLSVNDLNNFLAIQFKEGINFIPSLKKLAKENNPYALYELGNLEYKGTIAGYPRYDLSFDYHLKAANYDHPTSNWMLAHMIINKKIGSLSVDEITLAWKYLKKAEELESISALNTIGICYLNGYTQNKETDINKAIKYFKKAAEKNYIYAYNNLGIIAEKNKNYEEAFNYYLISANEEESWACNKIGEFYRKGIYVEKDLKKAYEYYNIGANCEISSRCNWNIINLVKYFYLNGLANIGIKKDINKVISLLEPIEDFKYASELLLYAYYELHLTNNIYLDKINYYLEKINNNILLNKEYKENIEKNLLNIKYKITMKD